MHDGDLPAVNRHLDIPFASYGFEKELPVLDFADRFVKKDCFTVEVADNLQPSVRKDHEVAPTHTLVAQYDSSPFGRVRGNAA